MKLKHLHAEQNRGEQIVQVMSDSPGQNAQAFELGPLAKLLLERLVFPYALSILFLIVAAVWIIWVSVAAGSQAGVLAGVAAMIARFATFGVVAATLAGAEMSPSGLGLLVVASVLLVLLGWIPGTAKKAWSAPRAEL